MYTAYTLGDVYLIKSSFDIRTFQKVLIYTIKDNLGMAHLEKGYNFKMYRYKVVQYFIHHSTETGEGNMTSNTRKI